MAEVRGRVFERLPGGGIGRTVAGASLTFVHERSDERSQAESDERGSYEIELAPGRYRIRAEHPDYEPPARSPGRAVVRARSSTVNFFLVARSDGAERVTSVFRGRVFERLPDGSIGAPVSGAALTFLAEEGDGSPRTVTSGAGGSYSVELPPGRYVVTADREGYEPFSSEPGVFVLRREPTVANLFLEPAPPTADRNPFTFRGDRHFHRESVL